MNAPITEAQLAAAAVAPRVTLEQVMAAIQDESYTLLQDGTTTIAQLSMAGGRFSSVGKSSCVSKENFNPDIGRDLARKDAVGQIWPLLGFELARKLELIDRAGPATGAIVSLLGSRPLTYVGTKVVRAVPMSHDTFLNLKDGGTRGSTHPEPGYLVEYTDGGAPNVEGFAGYISWSPKDVFEKAYTVGAEPRKTTFVERMQVEAEELGERLTKLKTFLLTPDYEALPDIERRELLKQSGGMEDYLWYLQRRLKRAEEKEAAKFKAAA